MAEQEREPDGNAAEEPPAGGKQRQRAAGKKVGEPKFRRGLPVATRRVADKKLKGRLKHTEALAEEAAASTAKAHQWLLPDAAGSLEAEGMERTWRFSQADIVQEVEQGAGRKVFDLSLGQLGPYSLDFTRSGRFGLLGGRKGHLALLDWHRMHPVCELQVKETVRDVHFLHNEQFFAIAQRKYVYIYDKRGIEVHRLKEHIEPKRLQFLPYHFLLASVGEPGVLTYQDTSTGQLVAQHKSRLGPCGVMAQNPWNAVLQLGHANGTVTMWTPNLSTPVVRLLAHRGPVSAIAVEPGGNQMVTAGVDGQVRVWDVRTLQPLHTYFSRAPATHLDISQRGLLAVGSNHRVQVWKDAVAHKAAAPYLVHELPAAPLQGLAFQPYEDTLAAGHGGGVTTLLVPGAGEPHFDSRVADPFQVKKARQEMEVAQLMDKLQPDMITLDAATVGQVRKEPKEVQKQRQAEAAAANAARRAKQREAADTKTRMKGKNRPTRRAARKKDNIIEERKNKRVSEQQRAAQPAQKQEAAPPEGVPRALHTFYRKA